MLCDLVLIFAIYKHKVAIIKQKILDITEQAELNSSF